MGIAAQHMGSCSERNSIRRRILHRTVESTEYMAAVQKACRQPYFSISLSKDSGRHQEDFIKCILLCEHRKDFQRLMLYAILQIEIERVYDKGVMRYEDSFI